MEVGKNEKLESLKSEIYQLLLELPNFILSLKVIRI